MLGCRPPKYVRAINFVNTSNGAVTLHLKFQSGAEDTVEVSQNETKNVERTINHGSYTTVDSITEVKASLGNIERNLSLNPQGVEIQTYRIVDEGNEFNLFRSYDQ